MLAACRWVIVGQFIWLSAAAVGAETQRVFRAGAAAVDITPLELPVRVSGSFFEHTASEVQDRLHARCVVLDDGRERIAMAVVDNCVIPREVFDEAKHLAKVSTGIPLDRMLMSATHTHSGPALDGLLGSDGNMAYRAWLPGRIAEAVRAAGANLAPARIGWTVVHDTEHTHCRQWIRRPDRIEIDPFGYRTIRSMMHPGYQNPDYLGPAGPVDPDLSIVSVQSPDGRPIALLANYSMHYVGAKPLSADYFGIFAAKVEEKIGPRDGGRPFVAMMSNGTSGDLHWMDYGQPRPAAPPTHLSYAEMMADQVLRACEKISYHNWVPLRMSESAITLQIRPISDADLAKARALFETFKDRKPKTLPEVYAWQQVQLSEVSPAHELKLQALAIGHLGIAAIPCEVFGITGLEIKARSPLTPTFTIELANGYDGYIPPPAQHVLGGYTTWRAISACLEVDAAPKIVKALLPLLEEVSGRPRRALTGDDYPFGGYPAAVLASKPAAYWRLNEFEGPRAADLSGNGNDGVFEPGVVFYLEGPSAGPPSADPKRVNRAPRCAGGRISARIPGLGERYSVEMWFSNDLPVDAREVTGYLFSRGADGAAGAPGDHLAIGGTHQAMGKLLFYNGDSLKECLPGRADVGVKTWNHVAMVRDGRRVTVYLNGRSEPEISAEPIPGCPPETDQIFIGGRSDNFANFEGRIDEVSIYNRPLSPDDIARHYQAASHK